MTIFSASCFVRYGKDRKLKREEANMTQSNFIPFDILCISFSLTIIFSLPKESCYEALICINGKPESYFFGALGRAEHHAYVRSTWTQDEP